MASINVNVRGLSGSFELELPEDSTVRDAVQAANLDEGLSIRSNGDPVDYDSPLEDDQVLVATAPAAKHGA